MFVAPLLLAAGCAHSGQLRHPQLSPLAIASAEPLAEDHFRRDRPGGLSEEALRAVLDAPVLLDPGQRLGVLPVTEGYRPERSLPLPAVPAELTRALDSAALFQATTEVSADWPADGDVPGLRELAARYRSGYLLLYRQRFADDSYLNAWALLYPTLIGAMLAPSRTLETAGVLEATLFDVRTGTILFTVYERVRGSAEATPAGEDRKLQAIKTRLLEQTAGKLAEQVVAKVRRLGARQAIAQPAPSS
jgi:hypothetical protein